MTIHMENFRMYLRPRQNVLSFWLWGIDFNALALLGSRSLEGVFGDWDSSCPQSAKREGRLIRGSTLVFFDTLIKESFLLTFLLHLFSSILSLFNTLPHSFTMLNLRLTLLYATLVLTPSAVAQVLYAATSDGNLTTLALTSTNGTYSLSITHKTAECATNPSWLTLDSEKRILYCLDRGNSRVTNGSLNSFSVGEGGNLTRVARTVAPLSGVHMELFGEGKRGMAAIS